MTDMKATLRALNDAAYAAAKAARKSGDPRAPALKQLALQTDDLVDQEPDETAASLRTMQPLIAALSESTQ